MLVKSVLIIKYFIIEDYVELTLFIRGVWGKEPAAGGQRGLAEQWRRQGIKGHGPQNVDLFAFLCLEAKLNFIRKFVC